ncbi:MAG: sugar lactone lactonase YvrE [Polyangiales bacterium]|jgi:sugar lactone lactonase YvrE
MRTNLLIACALSLGLGCDEASPSDAGPVRADAGADDARSEVDSGTDAGARDAGARDAGASDAGPPENPLGGLGAVEEVETGFGFLEGPHWRDADGVLLFTDIPRSTIHRLSPPNAVDVFRMPSGDANGLASLPDGRLLAAEHGTRRISVTEPDGSVVAVVGSFLGDRLNSPNDIAVRSDGTLYFTDPPYGLAGAEPDLSFNGVFRVDVAGTTTAEWMGLPSTRPNGIALSPDERELYVADTAAGLVRAFDVGADGSTSGERTFTTDTPNADGMAVDVAGNLFVATGAGVRVFAPDGTLWGTIEVPERPSNCAFGDDDHRTLYITARTSLYRVRLAFEGDL